MGGEGSMGREDGKWRRGVEGKGEGKGERK